MDDDATDMGRAGEHEQLASFRSEHGLVTDAGDVDVADRKVRRRLVEFGQSGRQQRDVDRTDDGVGRSVAAALDDALVLFLGGDGRSDSRNEATSAWS